MSQTTQFNISDSVIVFAAECRGLTNGVILNSRTASNGQSEYLVSTSFYIEWMRLTPENIYDPSRLATQVLPVDLPHPCSVRREDLPKKHTIDDMGAWRYVGPLTLANPPTS